ncbi:unnamed protein product [Phytomonas sp. Hart1]|nr:unnamed protein product [Phytomonas sp. Hart1]|eukprot:CCW67126.1 unnamed protein product [Phytomonas sp. isolate Hart1]
MSSVKRRLIYIADEGESALQGLNGTPPTRPSKLSFLPPIPSSSSESSVKNETAAFSNSAPQIDRSILISFDGFLLADGSGRISDPRNEAEAAHILVALRSCCSFLREYLHQSTSSDDFMENLSSFSFSSDPSSTEELSSVDSADSWRIKTRPGRKRTRPKTKKAQLPRKPQNPKATPNGREKVQPLPIQPDDAEPHATRQENDPVRDHMVQPSNPSVLFENEENGESEEAAADEPLSHPPVLPQFEAGPLLSDPAVENGRSSRGFWRAITSVGSLIFNQAPRSSTGELSERNATTQPVNSTKRHHSI